MKIFVLGGTGVIGSRVVPRLRSLGHEVTLFQWRTPSFDFAGHDAVINLATHIPPASRALLPGAWRATNRLRRTLPPILAKSGVRRWIQESFAPVYPDRGDAWIDESVPIAPVRYNRGVAAAEAAVASFPGTGIVLRFGYFYGPDSDFTQQMIGSVQKGWSPLPGGPESYVSSVAHDDAAEAVIAALDLPAGVYNVVDDEPVTRREYVDSLADRLGVRHPRFLPPWSAHLLGSLGTTLARSQRISNRKLRSASPWTPKYPSVREGWAAVVG